MVSRSASLDPPTYWREQLRAHLAKGGDPDDLDDLLAITGPPDVVLKGISTEVRSVQIGTARPPFDAHTWQTRMWLCLQLELHYESMNKKMDAKAIPTKDRVEKTTTCPSCGGIVLYEVPKRAHAQVIVPSKVLTYQRRIRHAWGTEGLDLPRIYGPLDCYVKPGKEAVFVAFRPLEECPITTDPNVDLDNILKALLDGLQSEGGRPGLLVNDRQINLLKIGRCKLGLRTV